MITWILLLLNLAWREGEKKREREVYNYIFCNKHSSGKLIHSKRINQQEWWALSKIFINLKSSCFRIYMKMFWTENFRFKSISREIIPAASKVVRKLQFFKIFSYYRDLGADSITTMIFIRRHQIMLHIFEIAIKIGEETLKVVE